MTNNKQQKGRWTARLVLRLIGAVALLIVGLMAVFGAFAFDLATSPTSFIIYWTAFAILLLIAIIIAMFDAIATIGKFRKEHAELRDQFRRQLSEQNDNEHKD